MINKVDIMEKLIDHLRRDELLIVAQAGGMPDLQTANTQTIRSVMYMNKADRTLKDAMADFVYHKLTGLRFATNTSKVVIGRKDIP